MGFHLSTRDRQRLVGVHPDLVKVVERAAKTSPIMFMVLEGPRSVAQQRKNVAAGVSWTMNSRHITGHAVDLVPLVDGRASWAWPVYHKLAPTIKKAAKDVGVPLEWGGDWRKSKDGPHWQLPWKSHPIAKTPVGVTAKAKPYTSETERASNAKEGTAIAAVGATGAVSVAPALPDIADALTSQQDQLTSGDYIRIGIAGIIICLTLYGIYRKVRA